jgi:hypothetical protein
MVDWLYGQDAASPLLQSARDQMLTDPRWGTWLAEPFLASDLDAAAAWLHRQHLVDGVTVDQYEGPVGLYLTDAGVACAEEFGADTARYVAAQRPVVGPAGKLGKRSPGSGVNLTCSSLLRCQPAEGDLDCAARASQSWYSWYEISSPSRRHERISSMKQLTGLCERVCVSSLIAGPSNRIRRRPVNGIGPVWDPVKQTIP